MGFFDQLTSAAGSLGKSIAKLTLPLGIITLVVVMVILLPVLESHPFIQSLELKTFDWRASQETGMFAKRPSRDIVLLNIDDTTLSLYEDELGTWPWARRIHADMITWLNEEANVKTLAYDLMFSHPRKGEGKQGDEALVKAFNNYDNVIFSMNLDRNYTAMAAVGKAPTPEEFEALADGTGHNQPDGSTAKGGKLDLTVMDRQTPLHTFNSMRRLLPGLEAHPERLAIVNHIRDQDGISRRNPLFFRLAWQAECDNGQHHCPIKTAYYPYLGLRLLLNITNPDTPLILKNNQLTIGERVVPLQDDGRYLIRWYNISAEQLMLEESTTKLEHYLANNTLPHEERNRIAQELSKQYDRLTKPFEPYPYKQISAWRVIKAMRDKNNTRETQQLKAQFKNKIVFVGTTAVSTFDIKTTPLHSALPGVVLQATLFDNLYQNAYYIKRASHNTTLIAAALFWLGCILSIVYTRSVWLGLAGVGACIVVYIFSAFWLYTSQNIWLSMAAPLLSGALITTLTYMLRYISRTQDFERTYKLATTDVMTGLKNHRYFQEYLANTIAQTQRGGNPCALILVDIDFFKKFNDTYGHQAGDRVLQAVSRKLEKSVRRGDLVARYGGEEMTVVLANADTDEALMVADKLVKAIADEAYPIAEDVFKHVTISVGVGVCPTHANTPSELIAFADAGLYRAKENGRNQVGSLA